MSVNALLEFRQSYVRFAKNTLIFDAYLRRFCSSVSLGAHRAEKKPTLVYIFTDKNEKKPMREIGGKCWSLGREIAEGSTAGAAIKAAKYKGWCQRSLRRGWMPTSGRRTDPVHPTEGRGRCGRGALELKFLL